MDPIYVEALEYDQRTLENLREQIEFATVMLQTVNPATLVPVSSFVELLEKLRDVAYSEE